MIVCREKNVAQDNCVPLYRNWGCRRWYTNYEARLGFVSLACSQIPSVYHGDVSASLTAVSITIFILKLKINLYHSWS